MKFLIFFSFFFLASAFEDLSNGKCSEKFVKSFLSRANYYRAKHSVGPLSLDDKGLSNYAQLTAYNIIGKHFLFLKTFMNFLKKVVTTFKMFFLLIEKKLNGKMCVSVLLKVLLHGDRERKF